MGKKLYVKCKQVLAIKVPQYCGLNVRGLIWFVYSKLDIFKFLPEYTYNKQFNRVAL